MEVMGWIVLLLGALISFVGGIWFLVVAFQESVLWGLAILVFPIMSFVFLFIHADRAMVPFLVQIWGVSMIFVAYFMLGI